MRPLTALLLGLAGLASTAGADPTWPSDFDDLEEVMYQIFGFKARRFADVVTPCGNEESGPGRFNSAEWLRTGFHDVATANNFFGTGGLDASLQYELDNDDNGGPGFTTTLEFMAPFFKKKTSLADLIALGVYTSVRSCEGPAVPIRYGRVDATSRGPTGVPLVQNSVFTFQQQFDRMGFNPTEMIQLVACGHTIGGVHSDPNAKIVPPNTMPLDVGPFDDSPDLYDNEIVTGYLNESTPNPLVRGPSVALRHNSDFRIFSSDGNATVSAMASNENFNDICKGVLGRMVDVVPDGVKLTDPVQPYNVKPVNLQLLLNDDAKTLQWTGFIRVRTTELLLDEIEGITITYKDRYGGSSCGGACSFTITHRGIGSGFDDSFAFFPINRAIPASRGISSFTVTINMGDGDVIEHDNNGKLYPMQDAIILQKPQSCLLESSGTLLLTVAVRNDVTDHPIFASITYKTPQTNSPVPRLREMSVELEKGECHGMYTLFSVDATIPSSLSSEATIDIMGSKYTEALRRIDDIGERCSTFEGPDWCSDLEPEEPTSIDVTITESEPTSIDMTLDESETATISVTLTESETASIGLTLTESKTVTSATGSGTSESESKPTASASESKPTVSATECRAATSASESEPATSDISSRPSGSPSGTNSSGSSDTSGTLSDDTSKIGSASETPTHDNTVSSREFSSTTASPTAALEHLPTVGAYSLLGCWKEAVGSRALDAKATAALDMTLDKCEEFCSGYRYFGAEYANECFCGNKLHETSEEAPLDDCNMECAGDSHQYCGAGNRLELYINENIALPPQPTAIPTVGKFTLEGCFTDNADGRSLYGASFTSDDLTLSACAEFCSKYRYFGTEYSTECYCGNTLHSSTSVPLSECNLVCGGNSSECCGAGNRLSLYLDAEKEPVEPEHPPTVGRYEFLGCTTELPGVRALTDQNLAEEAMTNQVCADFCDGYMFFGTQYGVECYCGDVLNDASEEVEEDECGMVCGGSDAEFCGDGNRLSVYKLKV